MLLLPQLVQIWLPDYSAARHENFSSPLSAHALRPRVPPLISFLVGLSDVFAPDESPGKRLPCGHVVSLRSILACCNLLGNATWTPAPHCFGCAQPDCQDTCELPRIPDPRVVDGLEARLDLIEWSWKKAKPTRPEMDVVSLLRSILSRIGHLSREAETESDAEVLLHQLSESALFETEAFGLMAEHGEGSAEVAERGTQPYCSYRAIRQVAGYSLLRYPILSPGQKCVCVTPHEYEREARSWALTPAEITDLDHHNESRGNEAKKCTKTVCFVAPVVTEVRYFEPWWCDEYRDSDRYWSMGPHRQSVDFSTSADDEWEIEILENPEGLAARISRGPEDEDSDCSTVVDDDDEEMVDEMVKADEPWDEEVIDGMAVF